jgi:hypothetical protein
VSTFKHAIKIEDWNSIKMLEQLNCKIEITGTIEKYLEFKAKVREMMKRTAHATRVQQVKARSN